ncbi:hypothetical protein SUGI_1179780 [Cryptomeria japonica]|nr:hypothetical protein SUGI_1179780 [Cryptomeria japonica]
MVSFKRLTVDWLVYLFSLRLTGMEVNDYNVSLEHSLTDSKDSPSNEDVTVYLRKCKWCKRGAMGNHKNIILDDEDSEYSLSKEIVPNFVAPSYDVNGKGNLGVPLRLVKGKGKALPHLVDVSPCKMKMKPQKDSKPKPGL